MILCNFVVRYQEDWSQSQFISNESGSSARPYSTTAKRLTMALTINKLTRKENAKAEEAIELEAQIVRLEEDIRKLKIDFDIYFNGATKRPPLEARARLESVIKRLSDNRALSYAQRYQLSALVSRFTAYRELWRRTLKARGEEFV